MNNAWIIELVGYIGSLLVVVSMLMSSVLKLRVINMSGSVIFMCYALIIRSYPTAVMNFALTIINIYHLYRLRHTDPSYELVDAAAGQGMVDYLLSHYAGDIRTFFPEFSAKSGFDTAFLVLCDTTPAGLLLGKKEGEDALQIVLDYSTPAYRDCSVGAFLYAHLPEKGIRRLFMVSPGERHAPYLVKMGFSKQNDLYVKELT